MIKVLLLDLDNTLVDRQAALRRYLQGRFPPEALPWIEEIDDWGYLPRMDLCTRVMERYPRMSPAAFWEDLRHGIAAAVLPDEAVLEALSRLPRPRLVLSNGSSEGQREKLRRAGLEDLVDEVLISAELGLAKPDPGIFRVALDRARVRPEEALMVGDDPRCDIEGAAALGIRTAWVRHGRAMQVRSDLVVERFSDLRLEQR